MADFLVAYKATCANEGGGLVNVAGDRGGMTYAGIARAMKPGSDWAGWEVIDRILKRTGGAYTPTAAESAYLDTSHSGFFFTNFWIPIGGDKLRDQDLADKLFDVAVNCGGGNAVVWLQTALNISNRRQKWWADIRIDGALGPATLQTIDQAFSQPQRRWLVLQLIECQQERHYFEMALRDEAQEEFLLGWFSKRIQFRSPMPA